MMHSYHTILIILSVIALYMSTRLLAQLGLTSLTTHRRIWNIALALFALVSALLGLVLAISLDHEIILSWYRTTLWVHVEFGIALAVVALFHFSWHLRYYLSLIKR